MIRALDLFCKAGGATRGLQRAGFHVTGVDISPQPNYIGDAFIKADALTFNLTGFDFIWASPPCQAYSSLRRLRAQRNAHPALVDAVRARLASSGAATVIENVPGAPLLSPVTLCGSMFGLAVRRHRLFESSFAIVPPACACRGRRNVAVYGKRPGDRLPDGVQRARDLKHGSDAMGIGWMEWSELTQAIPPAYSEFIAREWLRSSAAEAA